MRACFITLGCSKNQVDSEMLITFIKNKGFEIIDDVNVAEIIVINTCGFIASAKEEAINTIIDMGEYKEKGSCKHLIITGCLAKRYKKEIYKELPEVDLVIGVDEYENIDKIFSSYFNLKNSKLCLSFSNRIISSIFPMAYLRISDGCDNRCNYCAIPLIRGHLKSRKIEHIVKEAEYLTENGIKEICVISQDTTSYGKDIYGGEKLLELLKKLSEIKNIKWIRVLYMYPGKVSDELINEFKNNDKLCKYFDIPIQHISDNMLKAMNRHNTKKDIYDLVNKIRKNIPNAIIRTTVMVGYQGETDKDFKELLDGIQELKFDRLGAFTFSKEDDTKANYIDGDIEEEAKNERFNKVMGLQQNILDSSMKERIGKTYEVVAEDVSTDEQYYVCRSYMDAPDVDPRIYLPIENNKDNIIIGEYYNVKLIKIKGYDYIAELQGG